MMRNFLLVWLDGSIDEDNNDDYCKSITQLRQLVDVANTFTAVDECIDFITDIKYEKVFMIVSGTFSQIIVPIIQDIAQVSSVYIFCKYKTELEQCIQQWRKVKGVFTNVTPICEALKQAAYNCDRNMVSISFVKSSNDEPSNQNTDQQDQSFMNTQLLKEILLTINFEQKHINEFLTYCREQYAGNTSQLKNIDGFEQEYHHHKPIWWYTSQCFLYSMLNRALRMMEVDLIIKMGFFIKDLHKNIVALHLKQYGEQNHYSSFTVYRGQGLSQADFEQLMKTKYGLLSFNNFLSTSLDRAVSFLFADSNQYNPDTIGVLFEITINPSASSTSFTSIRNVSTYQTEEETLFSMHSVFRIGQIEQLDGNNRLWQVDLVLTSDNDPQLHDLTKYLSKEIEGSTGWARLGHLMLQLGHSNKAEEIYETLLGQTSDERKKANIYSPLGRCMQQQGRYTEAIRIFEKALEIYQKTLPPNHPDLSTSYSNIGSVYYNMGDYSKALSYYEKTLKIDQRTLPANHPSLATAYHNIGGVYYDMSEYSKALSYYGKALEIYQKSLPPNHPTLAASYNNIGLVYDNMGDYSKALSYYEKALEIRRKTLPPNHPGLAISNNNIGLVYRHMCEYSKALSSSEQVLEIYQKTLPPNHPLLATSYNNIGSVYYNTGEYSKALSSFEKALEIRQKTLPPNHPDLATSYNNIGSVYYNTGEYSKALSSYEKALEIRQKTLRPNHPDLATFYSNIGLVYSNMGEYSKALSSSEQALEIYQKTLPPNHHSFATSYNNIGLVYDNMGDYSKALSSYEKALEIYEKSLPSKHPNLAISYTNIGLVYSKMGEYSKALSSSEQALEIYQKTLPPNHHSFATSYNNIGVMYGKMGQYSKALSYQEKALEIRQKTLPPNHPNLLTVQKNIGFIKKKM